MTAWAVLAGVAARLCALGLTASAAWLIARAGAERPDLAALGLAIAAVRAFASARGLFGYLERLAGHDAALGRAARQRVRLYRALARGPLPGAGSRDADALTHMVADLDAGQDLRLRCALPAIIAGVAGAAAAAFCWALHPASGAIVAGGMLAAGAAVPAGAAAAARRLGARLADARAELTARVLDLTEGRADLLAFGALDFATAAAERQAARLARVERAGGSVSAAALAAGAAVQGLTALGVAWTAAGTGAVTSAVLVLTALAALDAVQPAIPAAQLYVALRPAAARVRRLIRADAALPPDERPHRPAVPGRVALRGVRVRYGDVPALDGVDLDLAPGRSVAVLGESGAGKSTLLALLAGLVQPGEGLALLRPARGLYQDAHLFAATVRVNLRMAKPDAEDAELRAVLDRVHLTGWLDALPQGLSTPVGAGGRGLSGGQRQRLLLARALLADPEVLLLDEPTEALDAATGRAVLAGVLRARRGRTTVAVTHREDALDLFDDIVIMARGRVELHDAGVHRQRRIKRG
ncbi:thiol reductant ABC exporter subunit CydC [Actinomadura chokoriensis]|uniref:thiol reductant ABC exporter subunit CydC n=1 Tax=Actinomadura chokoriensis TaxID=454156 RepID=UPI0031F73C5E